MPENIFLMGCDGLTSKPKCVYEMNIDVNGLKFTVLTLLAPGHKDDFILGINVLRPLIQAMKSSEEYWRLVDLDSNDPDGKRVSTVP